MKFQQLSNLPINKLAYFSFNLILIFISCSYIGLGAWLIDAISEKPNILTIEKYYTLVGGLMLATGLAGFFTACYGIALTFCRNIYSLFIYTSFLIILLLLGISVGIVGLVYADISDTKVTKELLTSNKSLIFQIQKEFKCCGLNGPNDWSESQIEIPISCCMDSINNCENKSYYKKGCIKAVYESIRLDLAISGAISLAMSLVLILGIVLSGNAFLEMIDKKNQILMKKNFKI